MTGQPDTSEVHAASLSSTRATPRQWIIRWSVLFGVIALVLMVDQISKNWALDNLFFGQTVRPVDALAPFFQLTLTENRGAAFGFLPQASDIFLIIAFVVTVGMLIFYPRVPSGAWAVRIGMGLISGGALGNALDRLQHGAVIDFIHYQIPGLISNVSNLADHAIVAGVLIILVESWRADSREKSAPAVESASPDSPPTEPKNPV